MLKNKIRMPEAPPDHKIAALNEKRTSAMLSV